MLRTGPPALVLRMIAHLVLLAMLAAVWAVQAIPARKALAEAKSGETPSVETPVWGDDYAAAAGRASESGSRLLVWFDCGGQCPACRHFAQKVLTDDSLAEGLNRYERVRIAPEAVTAEMAGSAETVAEITGEELPPRLLDTERFAYMYGRHGLAVVDMTDPESPHFEQAVSQFPFSVEEPLSVEELAVALDLPTGSLTQRTMIYAVRMHPELPQSTSGEFSPVLAAAAAAHSEHQSRICRQGHHNWERRFHELNPHFPEGMVAREVCAESWRGEELVTAAIGCVQAWRQSPGHWGGVRAAQPFYGYDIERGKNGIWYATGLFVAPYGD